MAAKYLDTSGLQYLWSKIKTWAKRMLVSSISYDGDAKAIKMTKYDGTNDTEHITQVVSASTIVTDGGGITQHQDISGKADKVANAASGDLAGLDNYGNLTDSGLDSGKVLVKPDTYQSKNIAVFAGSGQIVDSGILQSNIVQKSQTAGLLKNDGTVDTNKYLTSTDISGKADKVSGASPGDIATLDINGNLVDSGLDVSKLQGYIESIDEKADKVANAASGDLAGLDSKGNLVDSGYSYSDFATASQGALADTAYQLPSGGIPSTDLASNVQTSLALANSALQAADVSGKADKVSGATNGNFAGLDSNGNLVDSGHKHSDYLTEHQDITGKVDKLLSGTAGNVLKLSNQGGLEDSGFTLGTSVPANAVFTDTLNTVGCGPISGSHKTEEFNLVLVKSAPDSVGSDGDYLIGATTTSYSTASLNLKLTTNSDSGIKQYDLYTTYYDTKTGRYEDNEVITKNGQQDLLHKRLNNCSLVDCLATTPSTSDNSTKVATTAFVKSAISSASGNYVSTSSVGAASGVCPLDSNTKIDSQYLPSYVDDVIEAYARTGQTELSSTWLATGSASGSAITPETGKIYLLMNDTTNYSANTQFRWSGTTYVKLNDGGVSAITNSEIDSITNN